MKQCFCNLPWLKRSGMTILEVLIALFILSAVTTAVIGVIVTGDKISGRRSGVSYATTIAKNEAERLRAGQSALTLPGDTAYSDTVNGIVFGVSRSRIGESILAPDSVVPYQEYAISVSRIPAPGPVVTLRVLQGYNGATAR
jgi:type II secretory pathway pseudopilin PulG